MSRATGFPKILVGIAIGACVGGGVVYASQERQDALAKWLRLHRIGTPIGAAAGGLLGALIGFVVAGLDRKNMAQLVEVSAQMKFELFEQPAQQQLAPFRRAFHDVSFASPGCLMTGKTEDCQVSLLDCKVFRAVGGYKGYASTTVVLLPNDEPRLADFDLIPHEVTVPAPMNPLLAPVLAWIARCFRSAGAGSPLERRFQRYYDVRVFGRPAKLDLVHRVLSQEAVTYFAENPGWTARAHADHLLIWDSSESECAPKHRPDLVEKALQIRRLLKQVPSGNRETPEAAAAVI